MIVDRYDDWNNYMLALDHFGMMGWTEWYWYYNGGDMELRKL